ncbi:MAG: hypothetical protein NVS2B14_19230 [Chamaesiphon sp.]
MTRTHVTPESSERKGLGRKDLVSSLVIGLVLGIFGGMPLGWFAHKVYYQQHSGQVLLCRQKHIGQPEYELQSLCGSAF